MLSTSNTSYTTSRSSPKAVLRCLEFEVEGEEHQLIATGQILRTLESNGDDRVIWPEQEVVLDKSTLSQRKLRFSELYHKLHRFDMAFAPSDQEFEQVCHAMYTSLSWYTSADCNVQSMIDNSHPEVPTSAPLILFLQIVLDLVQVLFVEH